MNKINMTHYVSKLIEESMKTKKTGKFIPAFQLECYLATKGMVKNEQENQEEVQEKTEP